MNLKPNNPSVPTSATTATTAVSQTPTDVLLNTPTPVIKLLSVAAPLIYALERVTNLLLWQSSFWENYLLLLCWWVSCLFGTFILKYGVNGIIILAIVVRFLFLGYKRKDFAKQTNQSSPYNRRRAQISLTPANYTQLLTSSQTLANHITTLRATVIAPICALFSHTIPNHSTSKRSALDKTAWFCVTSYPFYLLVTFIVPMRLIFLIAGSLVILWNAPFFKTVRSVLAQSAALRWFGRVTMAVLRGGEGFSEEIKRTKSNVGVFRLLNKRDRVENVERKVKRSEIDELKEDLDGDEEEIQVVFTVMENQRWWVGLDWTHALLPNERASWTDPALNPSNPPSSFALPAPTTTYIASPIKEDPERKQKRTLEWKWVEDEWRVMTSSAGAKDIYCASSGVVPDNASTASENSLSSPITSKILGSCEDTSSHSKPLPISTAPNFSPTSHSAPQFVTSFTPDSQLTSWQVDADGWQYGDNHFEKLGEKAGLGKYTRRRAWIRRAELVERVSWVSGKEYAALEAMQHVSTPTGQTAGRGRAVSAVGAPILTGESLKDRLKNSLGSSPSREDPLQEKEAGQDSELINTLKDKTLRRRLYTSEH